MCERRVRLTPGWTGDTRDGRDGHPVRGTTNERIGFRPTGRAAWARCNITDEARRHDQDPPGRRR
ncbi:hypothetical protein BOSE125_50345 [Bosea sp. 125]|nr:hypothetical protein BOSE29B_30672 [Bosea sp. 29B]VXC80125.1 hypothetical protein BOSE125_50345 [Bosea sp. 125]